MIHPGQQISLNFSFGQSSTKYLITTKVPNFTKGFTTSNMQWDERAVKSGYCMIKSTISSQMRDWFWVFGDTTQFKTNHLQWFEKTKMEFLNLLCHLLFPALLQSSLVEYNNFVMLFLGATSFMSLCMAVISMQYTNIRFSLHGSYPFTLLYGRNLVFCLRMLHILKLLQLL